MNQLLKRYLGLLGTLVCTAVLFGAFITQIIHAQENPLSLTTEFSSLSALPGEVVTVTIAYVITEPTKLYYYPPVDFQAIEIGDATPDSGGPAVEPLDTSQGLRWDVNTSGEKRVVLRVGENVTEGSNSHGAILESGKSTGVLQLTQPPDAQPTDTPSPTDNQPTPIPDPELEITRVISDINESVEPGRSFYVTVTIQNKGGNEADNVKLVFGSTTDLLLLDESLTEEIGSVPAGEQKNQRVLLTILDNLLEGEYKLSIELYVNDESVDEQEVTIQVIQALSPPYIELNPYPTVTELEAEPGTVRLELVFENTGGALPENASLVLRYPAGMLSVLEAMINGESKPGENDDAGHAWGELTSFDGRNEVILELNITRLKISEGFTPDKEITVAFVSDDKDIWSDRLPQDTLNKLAESAPSPANTSDLSNSSTIATGQTVTNTGSVTSTNTTTDTFNTASTATSSTFSTPDGTWESIKGVLKTLGVGFVVLLLLGTSLYFLLRLRKRTKPAPQTLVASGTNKPLHTVLVPPPGTSIPVPPPLAFQPYLRSSDGSPFAITSFPFTIGRGENNSLIIDESFPQWQSVSRTHARIVQHAQGFVIEDQGSHNRLRVQGRLTERNLLRNGWQVRIGGVEFTFHDGSNASGGAA